MIDREATDDDVRHICRNLRPEDAREQYATRWHEDPDALADELIGWRGFAIKQYALCCDDEEPAVLVGAYMAAPGVAMFHMCSTHRLGEIGRAGHRWGKRRFIPFVLAPNVRMAETRILADHAHARRWVATCGFVEVGQPLPLGKNGEPFVHVAWINRQGS